MVIGYHGARGLEWELVSYDDAWDVWDAWAAWAAWAARDALAALTVEYAALNKWTNHNPMMLTTGIRSAYANGLAIAVPVSKNTLGWAMRSES